jgi:hypothetical protein
MPWSWVDWCFIPNSIKQQTSSITSAVRRPCCQGTPLANKTPNNVIENPFDAFFCTDYYDTIYTQLHVQVMAAELLSLFLSTSRLEL